MTNVKEKIKELSKYLEGFIIQSNWLDTHVPEQARSIFTTICFVGNIDADTRECDNMLVYLYDVACIEDCDVSYEEFESFMVELIV